MVTIELEDKGQDFTRWTCDDQGVVVKCEPFQSWLWVGAKVLNPETLKRGDVVDFLTNEGYLKTLIYRVESVKVH